MPHKSNLDIALEYLRAIEDRLDFDELKSFFTTDIIQIEYPNRLVPQGAERTLQQLQEAGQRGRQIVESQHYEVRNALSSEDWVALEVTWTARFKIAIGSLPAGSEMRANFGVFLNFRDGKIVRQHNYDCFDPF